MGPIASPQSRGPGPAVPGGWHPTVMYMLVLVALEIVAVGLLSRTLLR